MSTSDRIIQQFRKAGYKGTAEIRRKETPCGPHHYVTCEYGYGALDYPIMVSDRILYDWPERVPDYVKTLVARAFKWLENRG